MNENYKLSKVSLGIIYEEIPATWKVIAGIVLNEGNACKFGNEVLAKFAGVSKDTIPRILTRMENAGVIKRWYTLDETGFTKYRYRTIGITDEFLDKITKRG